MTEHNIDDKELWFNIIGNIPDHPWYQRMSVKHTTTTDDVTTTNDILNAMNNPQPISLLLNYKGDNTPVECLTLYAPEQLAAGIQSANAAGIRSKGELLSRETKWDADSADKLVQFMAYGEVVYE